MLEVGDGELEHREQNAWERDPEGGVAAAVVRAEDVALYQGAVVEVLDAAGQRRDDVWMVAGDCQVQVAAFLQGAAVAVVTRAEEAGSVKRAWRQQHHVQRTPSRWHHSGPALNPSSPD